MININMAIVNCLGYLSICIVAFLLLRVLAFMSIHFQVKFFLVKNFLKTEKPEVALILPSVDWLNQIAWIKANYAIEDIKITLNHIKSKGKRLIVSFGPNFEDVEKIMRNKEIREIYFLGHGGTDFFRLGTIEILCYSSFNDPSKYGKNFVHQVHCGSGKDKKSLIDYVVPEKNREKCFFHPDEIATKFIEKKLRELESLT